MNIGIIIPTRGDRPALLNNCLRMMAAQTLQPKIIEVISEPPLNSEYDITLRYRIGYEKLRRKNLELIAFIEDDDWYHPQYLEIMYNEWKNNGCPNLFGHLYTIYYHFKLFRYFTMEHIVRSSAMNTFIAPDMNFKWCSDIEPYTDIWLWNLPELSKKLINPPKLICMGMKHGIGKCGGHGHNSRLDRFNKPDESKYFLKSVLDEDSFEFYNNYFNK